MMRFLLPFCLACLFVSSGNANDDFVTLWKAFSNYDKTNVMIRFTDGKFAPVFSKKNELDHLHEYFGTESFSSYLDLSTEQLDQFKDINEDWKKEMSELSDEYYKEASKSGNSKAGRLRVFKSSRQLSEKMLERLDDLLVKRQINSLFELQNRALAQRIGLVNYLTCKPGAEHFEIDSKEILRIHRKRTSLHPEVLKKINKEMAEALSRLFRGLDEKQLAAVKKRHSHLFRADFFWLGILSKQCSKDHSEIFEERADESSLLKKISTTPFFVMQPCGRLTTNASNSSSSSSLLYLLVAITRNEKQRTFLEISDVQQVEIDQIYRDFKDLIKSKSDQAKLAGKNGVSKKVREELAAAHLDKLKDIFVKAQLDQLKIVADNNRYPVMGPIVDLIDGQYGDQIGLTAKQKKQIRNNANTFGPKLDELARKLYEHVLDELVEELDEDSRSKVKSMLELSKKESCNVDLIVHFLKL